MKSLVEFICEKLVINKDIVVEPDSLPDRLSEDEIDELTKYFEDNVVNIDEIQTNNGKFSICFNKSLKTGQNGKVRIVITKPPRADGGYNIALYKAHRWMAQNVGGKNKKKNGEPLFNTFSEVIEYLNRRFINGTLPDALGAKIKK